jgi:4-hydroxybenzoate polyprenyltransferase
MNYILKYYFLLIVFFCKINNTTSYVLRSLEINKHKQINCKLNDNNLKITKPIKIDSYCKLLRTNSIFPTFLLNVLGGWLTIPSYQLFLNKNFWLFSFITQLTMMNSMVVNDLFDLKIDLINNANRPLVNKEISIKQAQCLYLTISVVTHLISAIFFRKHFLYVYILAINWVLFLYTPVLKKILFIKNLTCSSVVSSTLLFTSKSLVLNQGTNTLNLQIAQQPNLINITTIFLFLSSLYIELLLDIKDRNGDKINNIVTVPNYFGVKKTLDFLLIIFTINFFYHGNIFYKMNNSIFLSGFILSNLFFFKNLILFKIKKNYYSDKMILNSVKDTTKSLVILIISILLSR